jgi:fluoroquinolone resistance protein
MNSVFSRTVLKEADLTAASNYIIDPESNNIRKAKFSISGVSGLLNKYDISIE